MKPDPDRSLADLAATQHGIFTLDDARAAGLTGTQIDHRVGRNWVLLHDCVYRAAAASNVARRPPSGDPRGGSRLGNLASIRPVPSYLELVIHAARRRPDHVGINTSDVRSPRSTRPEGCAGAAPRARNLGCNRSSDRKRNGDPADPDSPRARSSGARRATRSARGSRDNRCSRRRGLSLGPNRDRVRQQTGTLGRVSAVA
jgi:hypothetical protein